MKFILILILFSVQVCMGQELSVAAGYGQQDLQWSIKVSRLKWKNVGGPVTAGSIRWNFVGRWQLEGEYERMFFSSGKVYDTDYDGANVTYDEQFSAGKGGSGRWMAGLGYKIPVRNNFSIIPSVGYGMFNQSFYIYGFNDLNSTYKTKWKGAYGQVLCSVGLTNKFEMNVGVRYNEGHYRANANWNLVSKNFRHTANGYGINGQAAMWYHVSKMHAIGIKGGYSSWQTGKGVDELYLASGEVQRTQLNEVRSTGWGVMVEWRMTCTSKK